MQLSTLIRGVLQHPLERLRSILKRSRQAIASRTAKLAFFQQVQQNERAVACLEHAIEYLKETMPLHFHPTDRMLAAERAITILVSLHQGVLEDRPYVAVKEIRPVGPLTNPLSKPA